MVMQVNDVIFHIPHNYIYPRQLCVFFCKKALDFKSNVPQALAPVGAIFGAPVSGVLADRWGRKTALVLCGVPYFIGYLTLCYAHYMPTALGFKALALTGRFLTGVGMGWAGSVGPVSYI